MFYKYSLADLFNRIPSRFLWEAFSHTAINAHGLFVHTYPPLSTAKYSLIQLNELDQYIVEHTCPRFNPAAKGFRIRVLLLESATV